MSHDSTRPYVGGAAAVKAVLLASKDLRPNERLVLVAIAAHTNGNGEAWPSVATIAEYAGVSTRTVQRALAKLVQLGRLAVRQAANVATRVYRLVTGQPAVSGGDSERQGVTNGGPEGDSQGVTRSVEKIKEKNYRAGARDWRQWLKTKNPNPNPSRPPYTPVERRGAALPPANKADQCSRHRGSLASNCGPCRSERLAGGVA
ncbi:helix-turn-helix domain-containing protein [Micromonospora auratinigra]|uniref:Helix-turn-helix domain-containing protein n=1 Tax=Micromonospora auratinigra TaxID=261654 RepID=A0A1A9A6Z5_9ACTN|nr:helix-turn-helix domain-containing protein [Micromonospora auratinigra]SBT51970.1 Helix-turn-helix domain-containing protein [Micromonospora auratinigra]